MPAPDALADVVLDGPTLAGLGGGHLTPGAARASGALDARSDVAVARLGALLGAHGGWLSDDF